MQDFQNIIEKYKDKKLELDPYFYERQEKLHKATSDIKNGSIFL